MAVLLPIKKDSLASKLCTSNVQPLTSHNAKNVSIATFLSTETMDSNSKKTTVTETETEKPKGNETIQQGTIQQKRDVQNSQNFTNDIKSIV